MVYNTPTIILGSSSTTRFDLLTRLSVPFSVISPDIDESPQPHESVQDLVLRLAHEKAYHVARKSTHQRAIIISSDELLVNLSQQPSVAIGKPHSVEKAKAYLMAASGCLLCFYTSICVYDYQQGEQGMLYSDVVATQVQFRKITPSEAEKVVAIDQPLSCAGAFRSEGAGVSLCERISEPEPGALMGLPLITLSRFLRQCSNN